MSRKHEIAERFCTLVKAPHLIAYLGLHASCSSDEARTALHARKKYLESVQDLPEFRKEASTFIRNFDSLFAVLEEPETYVHELTKQKIFKHLPELRTTIQDVLENGILTHERVAYLRREALNLGVTMDVFEEMLSEEAQKAGVARPEGDYSSLSAPLGDFASENPYKVLGASRHAKMEALREAYEVNLTAAQSIRDPQKSLQAISAVENAWKTLSDQEERDRFDSQMMSQSTGTGPTVPVPALRKLEPRRKKTERDKAATDPLRLRPRKRVGGSKDRENLSIGALGLQPRAQNIEITHNHSTKFKVIQMPVTSTLTVHKRDQRPLFARVSTDQGWLVAFPAELDQDAESQEIEVRINPKAIYQTRVTGKVTIQLETGEKLSTPFDVERVSWWSPLANVPAFIGTVALLGMCVFMLTVLLFNEERAEALEILVDPSSEAILINGKKVGSGSRAYEQALPLGLLQLDVVQSNFAPHRSFIEMEPGITKLEIVQLKLTSQMDFRPSPDMTLDKTIKIEDIQAKIPDQQMFECMKERTMMREGVNKVIIYLGQDGKAAGVDIEGPISKDSVVNNCLTRQAATISHLPLTGGDYAVLVVHLEDP